MTTPDCTNAYCNVCGQDFNGDYEALLNHNCSDEDDSEDRNAHASAVNAQLALAEENGNHPSQLNDNEDDQDEDNDDEGRLVTDGGWITDTQTTWCSQCQRYRVNCAHLRGGRR